MTTQNILGKGHQDWSKFGWDVIMDGMPTPADLVGHELRNEFSKEIYWADEQCDELWSSDRSKASVGPDELNADHLVEAYHDMFIDQEDTERARKVFEQALEDESIPDHPKNAVKTALDVYKGVQNYEEIIHDVHDLDDSVSYESIIEPVKDNSYVSINEDNLDALKQGQKEVNVGESVFFFLNTVDKNFEEYVVGEVEDPELNIDAYVEEDQLKLEVYDNGPGIPEDQNVFEPEFGNSTGLPAANYILDQYGADLELYDSPEEVGLRATFDLTDAQ